MLPFVNMSGDKEQEYFSDGLAEEIINVLTHISGLKVIARTSAFAFKGKQEEVCKCRIRLRVKLPEAEKLVNVSPENVLFNEED